MQYYLFQSSNNWFQLCQSTGIIFKATKGIIPLNTKLEVQNETFTTPEARLEYLYNKRPSSVTFYYYGPCTNISDFLLYYPELYI